MPARLGLIALISMLAAAGVVAGYTLHYGHVQAKPVAAPAPAGPAGAGPGGGAGAGGKAGAGLGPRGPGGAGPGAAAIQQAQPAPRASSAATSTAMGPGMGPRQGQGGGPRAGTGGGGASAAQVDNRVQAACISAGLNNQPIGQNIKWLFDNHNVFRYQLIGFPENRTLVWIITAPDKAALETLVSHVMQMECVVENGGTPRPFDPLFQVDAAITSKYVHTEIQWLNDTAIKIVKVADNDCAYEVIKLHAQVVEGFFDTGRLEAQKTHEVPQEALEICKPYLGGSR